MTNPLWLRPPIIIDDRSTTTTVVQASRPSTGGSGSGTVSADTNAASVAKITSYISAAQRISAAGFQAYDKASDKFTDTASLKDDLKAAKTYLAEIEEAQDKVAQGFTAIKTLVFSSPSVKNDYIKQLTSTQNRLNDRRVKYVGIVDELEEQIALIPKPETSTYTHEVKVAASTPSAVVAPTAPPVVNTNTAPNAGSTVAGQDTSANTASRQTVSKPQSGLGITYNVNSVKEAYFSTAKDYLKQTTYKGNAPSKISRAAQLWRGAGNSKGMFVMTNPIRNTTGIAPTGNAGDAAGYSYEAAWVKWGFQFLYNPATVNMAYQIGPAVDIGYLSSGQEKFNVAGSDGAFSTISFEVLINRMADMKYYNKSGLLTEAGKEQYGENIPTAKDQMMIYNKGTMYDLEYLLRTASAGTLIQQSWLRGITADLGFIGAVPIELHLGKNLRYWGTISALEVNHTIFNEKMIPVFTSVTITFSRLIDPPKKPGSK